MDYYKNRMLDDDVTINMESYKRLAAGSGVVLYRDTEETFGWLFMLVDHMFLFVSREGNGTEYIGANKVRVVTETKASDLLPAK